MCRKNRTIYRTFAVCAAVLFAASLACSAFAQDDNAGKNTAVMRGIVGSIDWVGSLLVVDEVQLSVTDNTEVYKGNSRISFAEIHEGDPVIVVYRKGDNGRPFAAVRITVEYSGDLPV